MPQIAFCVDRAAAAGGGRSESFVSVTRLFLFGVILIGAIFAGHDLWRYYGRSLPMPGIAAPSEQALSSAELAPLWNAYLRKGGFTKIGLCLMGGGGRGAFQIGAWRVLKEIGFEPQAVAGSSVGALNGALIVQGDYQKAETLWKEISIFKMLVLAVKPAALVAFTARTPEILRMLFVGVASAATSLFGLYLLLVFAGLAFAVTLWLAVAVVLIALVLVGLAGFLEWMDLVEDLRLTYFSNKPIKDLISRNLQPDSLRNSSTELIVTTAFYHEAFDPENPTWTEEVIPIQGPSHPFDYSRKPTITRKYPKKVRRLTPGYHSLNELEPTQANELILQSAALPRGIYPQQWIANRRHLDGGEADNIPIYPLAERDCDLIVVIHLDVAGRDSQRFGVMNSSELEQRLSRIHHLQQLNAGTTPGRFTNYEMPYFEILHILPSRSLGNFATGTLNFTSGNARRLMKLGYEDALRCLTQALAREPAPRRRTRRKSNSVSTPRSPLLNDPFPAKLRRSWEGPTSALDIFSPDLKWILDQIRRDIATSDEGKDTQPPKKAGPPDEK
jgi:predicted acylesterase/phospholipase RssA